MINKLTRKRPNRLLIARNNYFADGGQPEPPKPVSVDSLNAPLGSDATQLLGDPSSVNIKSPAQAITSQNYKDRKKANNNSNSNGIGLGAGIASIGATTASGIGNLINNINSNDVTQKADAMIQSANSAQIGAQSSSDNFDTLANDILNTAALSKIDKKQLGYKNFGQSFASAFAAGNAGFASGASINPLMGGVMATTNTIFDVIGNIFRNKKIKKETARVNEARERTNAFNRLSFNNRADNLINSQLDTLEANYSAYGGPLFAFGGDLMTHGGDFSNGVILIGNGGTHESNPYEGVPMGVDPEGTPNLVEEGEVIFNDYVFSKRLKVPKAVRNKYKLGGPLTFADAALRMSKEAEERPNDPISQNGLEALLGELAYAQEGIRERKQVKNTYAYGGEMGNIFSGKGDESNRLKHNNSGIDFSYLYKNGSKYMKNRDYVLKHWDDDYVKKWREQFINAINEYNNGLEGFTPYTLDSLTKDDYERLSMDKKYGAIHSGTLKLDPTKNTIIKHTLRGANGPVALDPKYAYYAGYSPTTKRTWAEDFGDMYTRVDSGRAQISVDPETGANVLEYLYDPVKKEEPAKPKKFRFYDYAEKYDENSPYREYDSLDAAQAAGEDLSKFGAPKDGEGTTVYRGLKPPEKMPSFDNWMRYTPIVGNLVGLGLSSTSKPDESGAEAILEASRGAGTYKPVRFSPVGNYLTYNPFDLDIAVNQANAESAAARRALMNTSGGNRAQAMAGILAADNNALNQLGVLRRGAAEDNLKQRQLVEDFNRATNEFNSEGFLKADMANQAALAQAKDLSLRGTMAAEEMRQRAKLARDNAIQANISGLFNSMGNIGQERVARQQMQWIIDNGFAPGYGSLKDNSNKNNSNNNQVLVASKGGKIKRKRKGLTY